MKRRAVWSTFILAGLCVLLYAGCALANAPVLSDAKLNEHLPISSSLSGEAWVVSLTVDVLHDDNGANPITKVSNLTLRAYPEEDYGSPGALPIAEVVDHPFNPGGGDRADDYPVSIEIPKSASDHLVIEICAKHGNNWGCTTWEGWVPFECSHSFSGSLQIPVDWSPLATGTYEGDVWVLRIQACGAMAVSVDTEHCRVTRVGYEGPRWEIPTQWRVWDDHGGELVNTGWISVASFQATFESNAIHVPAGWSGNISFQARMIRSGLGDSGGEYLASLTVSVTQE